MAGLALVDRKPTQPARAAISVKYIAVPKCLELRKAAAPMPCALAGPDRVLHGLRRQHLPHGVVAINHADRSGTDL